MNPCDPCDPCDPCKRFTFGAYGLLPKDCWTLIGNRCNITTKLKIVCVCAALKRHYFRQYAKLENWDTQLDPENQPYLYSKLLYSAAKGGHRDLIDLLILDGAAYFFDAGLNGAAKGGHRDLIDFFVKKGATYWNSGLHYAAQCNTNARRDLVDFFIKNGATDWNMGLNGAAKGGHRDIVVYLIAKCIRDNVYINWNYALNGAVRCKDATLRRDMVDYIIKKCEDDKYVIYWHWPLEKAAKGGDRDLVDLFVSKRDNDGIFMYGFYGALRCKDATVRRDLVDYFIEKGVDDWKTGLGMSRRYGHQDLIEFFESKIGKKTDNN